MPNFPALPLNTTTRIGISTGSKLSARPRVNQVEFGEGRTQRIGDGINNNPRAFAIRFSNLRRGEAIRLDQFFAERGAAKPFTFTVPGEATARQWLCTEWDRSFDNKAIENMTAKFEENFDA